MTTIEYAWIVYALGGLGCCVATWWMFLWAWRFVRYSAVITVMTILFTPYAIDPQTMMMAPAVFTLIFNGIALGVEAILPLIKLMLGIWAVGVMLALVFVLLTRNAAKKYIEPKAQPTRQHHPNTYKPHISVKKNLPRKDYLSYEERAARDELLAGEMPMRAIRD